MYANDHGGEAARENEGELTRLYLETRRKESMRWEATVVGHTGSGEGKKKLGLNIVERRGDLTGVLQEPWT